MAFPVDDLEKNVRLHVAGGPARDSLAKQLEEQAGDPAVLKEKLADVQEQMGRLNQAKEVVRIARTVLIEAAEELRREFAPYLNKALAAKSRITGGRHTEATSIALSQSVSLLLGPALSSPLMI